MRLRLIPAVLIAAFTLSSCLLAGNAPTAVESIPTTTPSLPVQPSMVPPAGSQVLPVIFDDDGSPDGTVALFYLLTQPEVSVEGVVTTYGEAHPKVYIQHMGRVLDDFGFPGIPLGEGQPSPLPGGNEFPEEVRQASGSFWGHPVPNPDRIFSVQPAAYRIASVVRHSPEPVTIFISGPCTDAALALLLEPDIKANIKAIYIMGGAVYVPGNIPDMLPEPSNRWAEWNIYGDPQAASQVFNSGLNVYLVPLDATNQVSISREDIALWRNGGKISDLAADFYDSFLPDANSRFAIWDIMTAQIMVHPELCKFIPLGLKVITEPGDSSGTTVRSGGAPNVNVCLEPDIAGIVQNLDQAFASAP